MTNENQYDDLIAKYSQINGVDPILVKAHIAHESGFNTNHITREPNDSVSYGLGQINSRTAAGYGVKDFSTLLQPEVNIELMTRMLRDFARYNKGHLTNTIASYNAGSARFKTDPKTGRQVYINEPYVKSVLGHYVRFGGVIPQEQTQGVTGVSPTKVTLNPIIWLSIGGFALIFVILYLRGKK